MSEEKKRLLILDDSKEFVFLLSTLFDFHKFKVDTEEEPERALKKCEENVYDAIITDYVMNPINGIQFSEKVRSSEKNANAQMILLTAKNLDEDELKKIEDLKIVYLKKPILPNKLQEKIMEVIG